MVFGCAEFALEEREDEARGTHAGENGDWSPWRFDTGLLSESPRLVPNSEAESSKDTGKCREWPSFHDRPPAAHEEGGSEENHGGSASVHAFGERACGSEDADGEDSEEQTANEEDEWYRGWLPDGEEREESDHDRRDPAGGEECEERVLEEQSASNLFLDLLVVWHDLPSQVEEPDEEDDAAHDGVETEGNEPGD